VYGFYQHLGHARLGIANQLRRLAEYGDITAPLQQAPIALTYHRMNVDEQYAELIPAAFDR